MPWAPKDIVKVSRHFGGREIRIFVTKTEVGAEVELSAFLATLVEDVGGGVFTKGRLLEKLLAAADNRRIDLQKEIAKEM